MNGLKLDRHSEEQAVELFAANIMEAGAVFLDNPRDKLFIPSWNRVQAAIPRPTRAHARRSGIGQQEQSVGCPSMLKT